MIAGVGEIIVGVGQVRGDVRLECRRVREEAPSPELFGERGQRFVEPKVLLVPPSDQHVLVEADEVLQLVQECAGEERLHIGDAVRAAQCPVRVRHNRIEDLALVVLRGGGRVQVGRIGESGDEPSGLALGVGDQRVHDGGHQREHDAVAVDVRHAAERGRVDHIHVRVEHLLERVDIGRGEPVRGRRRVHVDGDVRAHRLGSRGHWLVGRAIEAGAHREGAEAAQRGGCHGRDPGARGGGSDRAGPGDRVPGTFALVQHAVESRGDRPPPAEQRGAARRHGRGSGHERGTLKRERRGIARDAPCRLGDHHVLGGIAGRVRRERHAPGVGRRVDRGVGADRQGEVGSQGGATGRRGRASGRVAGARGRCRRSEK